MFDQLSKPKSKFPLILAGSITLHGALVGMMFVSWVWGIALKFGEIRFEDGGESTVKVAMLDRTKPLYMPPGFYAITKPPEQVTEPVERKQDEKPDADDQKKSDEDGEKDGAESGDKSAQDPKPTTGPKKFGTMQGGALKPHLQQIYSAYERGLITTSNFSVTVSCRAQADGSLADIRVTKSSGERLIDETAVNIMQELGNQRALAPLSELSSLSLTLEKNETVSTLAAVGFSDDPDTSSMMATELGFIKMASRFKMRNDDQMLLLDSVQISQSGNRVTVLVSLPNSRAGEMMQRSFGSTAKVGG